MTSFAEMLSGMGGGMSLGQQQQGLQNQGLLVRLGGQQGQWQRLQEQERQRQLAEQMERQRQAALLAMQKQQETKVPERPFSDDELKAGRASELRAVRTPAPGDTVEVGFILTDAVLVINRLVAEIEDLKHQNEVLTALMDSKISPKQKLEDFKLNKLAGEYEDDLE